MHPYINHAISLLRKYGSKLVRQTERLQSISLSQKISQEEVINNSKRWITTEIANSIQDLYRNHVIVSVDPLDPLDPLDPVDQPDRLDDMGDNQVADHDHHQFMAKADTIKWLITTLSGSTNLIYGIPHIAMAIGIEMNSIVEHAVIFNPWQQDLFVASKGRGTQLNDKRIRVNRCTSLANALLATSVVDNEEVLSLNNKHKINKIYNNIREQVHDVRNFGCSLLDLAYVAAGYIDGCWTVNANKIQTDIAALLVQEAGGAVSIVNINNRSDASDSNNSDIKGGNRLLGAADSSRLPYAILASVPAVHNKLKKLIAL